MKYAVLIAALCVTSMVNAGEKRRVVYQTSPVSMAQTKQSAPAPAPAVSSLPNLTVDCKCDSNNPGQPCDNCRPGLNKPTVEDIENGKCPDGKDCKDIPVVIDGDLESECHEEDFYVKCESYPDVEVDGPKLVKRCKETREFKTITYTVKCCKVKVCVPCKDCVEITEECEIAKIVAPTIKICKRTSSGKYDVYVIGVKGMPKEWMLFLDTDKAAIEAYFAGRISIGF